MSHPADDEAAIDDVVATFFGAFTSSPDTSTRLGALHELFLPEAVIVRTGVGEPAIYGVDDFLAPRAKLLADGSLIDFREWEVSGETRVFGDIAQRFCRYAKSGVQDGVAFSATGVKTIQLVRVGRQWRISAVAWQDE